MHRPIEARALAHEQKRNVNKISNCKTRASCLHSQSHTAVSNSHIPYDVKQLTRAPEIGDDNWWPARISSSPVSCSLNLFGLVFIGLSVTCVINIRF